MYNIGEGGINDWIDVEYWTEDGKNLLAKNQFYTGSTEFVDFFQKMESARKY